MNLTDIIAQWDSGEGKPYKGKLIDMGAWKRNPSPSCMCAQGQLLHYVGGHGVDWLASVDQDEADAETARVAGISRTHAVLLRQVNDSVDGAPSIVITHPEKVLGDQAQTVLAFWRYLDTMTVEQWEAVSASYATRVAANVARYTARIAASDAARYTANHAARVAANVGRDDARIAASLASNEIQGAAIMRVKGQPFHFLPLFGFADPEAVLAWENAQ